MLKKLYDKSEIAFTVVFTVSYCVLMSLGDFLSGLIKIEKCVTLPIALLLSLILFVFFKRHSLSQKHGLLLPLTKGSSVLFYIPLIVLISANIWLGFKLNCGVTETILYILTMFCVGFLEEVIFRGLLYTYMAKSNFKLAVAVSSLTFGAGHILNLFNGSGAEILDTALQIVYASAAGFMFVMLFVRTKSLIPGIIGHALFNSLSVFSNTEADSLVSDILIAIAITLISSLYGLYLLLPFIRKRKVSGADEE